MLFSFYSELDFLPANEAYRDNVRKDLDKSVLVDLCGLPERILDDLVVL